MDKICQPNKIILCSYIKWLWKSLQIHFFFRFYLFVFRERGGKGEREEEKLQREKETLIFLFHLCMQSLVDSCMCPNQGLNPQPLHVPWMGIEPATFRFVGQCPTNWSTPARARYVFMLNVKVLHFMYVYVKLNIRSMLCIFLRYFPKLLFQCNKQLLRTNEELPCV